MASIEQMSQQEQESGLPDRQEGRYAGCALLGAVGAMCVVAVVATAFFTYWYPEAELAAGVSSLVVGLGIVMAATAAGMPRRKGSYRFVVLVVGWLTCTWTSAELLVVYVSRTFPPGGLRILLLCCAAVLPLALVLATIQLMERRREIVQAPQTDRGRG